MRGTLDRKRRTSRFVCGLAALSMLLASRAVVAKPTAVKPTAVKPTAVKPTAVKPTAVKPTAAKPAAPAATSTLGVVNLNTASEEQLCFLPRIGPSKARRIIAYRTRHAFRSDTELVRVKGIGRKTYRLLRTLVTVKGETTMTRKAKLDRASP